MMFSIESKSIKLELLFSIIVCLCCYTTKVDKIVTVIIEFFLPYMKMKMFSVQFQNHHPIHWQSVWAISSWWKWVEPKAHRGQQGALLLLLYISIWTWVSVQTLLLSWNYISIFDLHMFVPADSGMEFVDVNSKFTACWGLKPHGSKQK